MDAKIVYSSPRPCDACPLPIPGSMSSKDSTVLGRLGLENKDGVLGVKGFETTEEAQGLLNLRITNELVSDDWLRHFLRQASSKGIYLNQLTFPLMMEKKCFVLHHSK